MLPALAACTAGQSYDGALPPVMGAAPPSVSSPPRRVAILVPLTGANAERGQALLRAAQLALAAPGSPALDPRDTGGTPEGAAGAARAALAAGDAALLGPLTAGETAATAPIAQAAGVPELAFTNDTTQARPGVWVLGITPGQQVRRLVAAARADGRTRIAAVLPNSPFGTALADAFSQASLEVSPGAGGGTPAPGPTLRYDGGRGLADALRDVSDYATRHQAQLQAQAALAPPPSPEPPAPTPPATDAARSTDSLAATIAGLKNGQLPASTPIAGVAPPPPLDPPPLDALLLAESGGGLRTAASELRTDGLTAPRVRLLGPSLWADAHLPALAGAWYAAPDPSSRAGFEAQYRGANGAAPPLLADLAYDAAAILRTAAPAGFGAASLLRPQGFAGVDGVLALLPDGRVRRGLALFELTPDGGSRLVQPAPAALAGSGA